MTGIAAVVEELLVATILSEKVLLPRKSKTDWTLLFLSGLLGAAGVFLAVLGFDRFLETIYPEDVAALIAAGVVLLLALLLGCAGGYFRRRKLSILHAARGELRGNFRGLIEDVCKELDGPVRDNPKMAVLLAGLAGFLAANHRP
jgi:hypothetical protein